MNITFLSSQHVDEKEVEKIISDFVSTHKKDLPEIIRSNSDDDDGDNDGLHRHGLDGRSKPLHFVDTDVLNKLIGISKTLMLIVDDANPHSEISNEKEKDVVVEESSPSSSSSPSSTKNNTRPIPEADIIYAPTKDYLEKKWQLRYDELVMYHALHGHCNVSIHTSRRNDEDNKYKSLAIWIQQQRYQYNRKYNQRRSTTLTPKRMDLLEKLGFQWVINRTRQNLTRDALWNTRMKELKEFHATFGHCNVPQKYAGNKILGEWVNEVRKNRKRVYETVRGQELDDLGFEWTPRRDRKVNRKKATTTTTVEVDPVDHTESTKDDESWRDEIWEKRYNELIEYSKMNGHCNVPYNYRPNMPLAKWVHAERFVFKAAKNTSRYAALKQIGFYFDSNDE